MRLIGKKVLGLATLLSLALAFNSMPASADAGSPEQVILSERFLARHLQAALGEAFDEGMIATTHGTLGHFLDLDQESASRMASNAPEARPGSQLRLIGAVEGQGIVVDFSRDVNGQETILHLVPDPSGDGRVQPRLLTLSQVITEDGTSGVVRQWDGAVLGRASVTFAGTTSANFGLCENIGNAICDQLHLVASTLLPLMVAACGRFFSLGPYGILVGTICLVAVTTAITVGLAFCRTAVKEFCGGYDNGIRRARDIIWDNSPVTPPLDPCDIECNPPSPKDPSPPPPPPSRLGSVAYS